MLDQQRYQMENEVLSTYLPSTAYRFMDMHTANPYLVMGVMTNHGKAYTIRIDLANYPQNVPEVYGPKYVFRASVITARPRGHTACRSTKYISNAACGSKSTSCTSRPASRWTTTSTTRDKKLIYKRKQLAN